MVKLQYNEEIKKWIKKWINQSVSLLINHLINESIKMYEWKLLIETHGVLVCTQQETL